jgi:imidazolonepropionase-like amidohydrolase
MRLLIGLVVVAACGSSPPPSAPPQPAKTAPLPAKTDRWVISGWGHKIGSIAITANPDGTFAEVYDQVDNGRGPHVDATFQLGSDGMLDQFSATGHHELGNALSETFSRTNGRAHWKSEAEDGEADATKPAFYNPLADSALDPWLIPAALRAGGSLNLYPSGTIHVDKVGDFTGEGRTLVCYAVSGFSLAPYYTWFDTNGTWFGIVYPFGSTVPEGAEKLVEPLVAKQTAIEAARAADIAKRAEHTPPAAGLAYTHARVLDVERGKWIPDQTVVIVGDTIRAVGSKPPIPAGAEVIDLGGKAVMPGLVDMHSHTDRDSALLDIAAGVTTVRDVGNDPDFLDDLKAHFDDGSAVGPHIVRMGFIEGRGPKAASSRVTAMTPDEAKQAVEFFANRKYDGIKIYNSVPVELVPLLATEAHKRNMLVIGHIPVHMLAHEAVEAGYDGIEHINMLILNFVATHDTDTRDTTRFTLPADKAADLDLTSQPVKDFIAELAKHQTIIDPTLSVFEGMFLNEPGKLPADRAATVARLPSQLARSFLTDSLPNAHDMHARYAVSWSKMLALVKLLWQAHVPIVAGTDTIGGVFLQYELTRLVGAGIPIADVLRAATVGSARAMRQDKIFGTIAAGKRADLMVVDGDPLVDISQVRKIVSSMRSGVVYDSAVLFAAASVTP